MCINVDFKKNRAAKLVKTNKKALFLINKTLLAVSDGSFK